MKAMNQYEREVDLKKKIKTALENEVSLGAWTYLRRSNRAKKFD